MQHLHDLTQVQLNRPSQVAIGVFDGVHIGHRQIIEQLVAQAHAADQLAVTFTFFPHPDVVFRNLRGRYYLTSPTEKARLLGELGVDVVITQPFDEAFRLTRAADFVDLLRERVHLTRLLVGGDFALGYKREGDIPFLRQQGRHKGFALDVVDFVTVGETVVRSSAIRHALNEGAVEQVTAWLARPFSIAGEVIHGDKRGRTIGFPTANVETWTEQVIPANGVYAGWATIGDERFQAVTNVGIRPTFAGQGVKIEAHLLDFDRDIYGETIRVTFEHRLRAEKKFNGIDELVAQIQHDVAAGRTALGTAP